MSMSTNIGMLETTADSEKVAGRARDGVASWISGLIGKWREGAQLRRTLAEVRLLGDRQLADIGLQPYEIERLRREHVFLPEAWRETSVQRSELPF